jgi:signal transduction histidine kinase
MNKKICIALMAGCLSALTALAKNTDSLYRIATRQPADTNQVISSLTLAAAYLSTQPDSAIYWSEKAIALAEKIPFATKWLSNGYNTLGMAYYYASNYREALQAFENYYLVAQKEKSAEKMGQARNNQGNVWIELGRYDSAIQVYKEALKIRQNAADSFGIAMSYNNLGYIYKEVGDYSKAVENMLLARRYFEKLGNKAATGNTILNIGQVYLKKKENNTAIRYFKEAAALFVGIADDRNLAIALHSIGNALSANQQYDSARYYYSLAEARYLVQKDDRNLALINADLAETYDREQLWAAAVPFFKKAIALNQAIGNKRSLGSIYLAYAANLVAQKQAAKAATMLDSAAQYLRVTNQKNNWRDYYKTQADLYKLTGQHNLAVKSLEQYILYSDSVLNETNIKAIADMNTKYETEKKEQENKLQKALISKKNTTIWAISSASTLMLLLGYSYYRRYKLKKEKELQAEIMHHQEIAARSVLAAEENERRRIAAELHDGVGQLMSAARMNLDALVRELQPIDEVKQAKLDRVLSLVDEGCREVRAVSHSMMPNALLKKGLASALQDFIQKIDQQVIKVQLHTEGLQERLAPETESILYRVIQECVNNVIKHSGADMLDIAVMQTDSEIDITIEDNGRGFDVNETADGIGLQNIKARIQLLKGSLEIDSAAGRGTFVGIHIPSAKT